MRAFRAKYKINVRKDCNLTSPITGLFERGDYILADYVNQKSADGHVWAKLTQGRGWCAISNGGNQWVEEIKKPTPPLGII